MKNGNHPTGTGSPLDANWQVAQARDLLVRHGYAVIPKGGARLFEMRDKYDPATAPPEGTDERKAHFGAKVHAMAQRLGTLLVNAAQVELVMTPGQNGLPTDVALRILVVSPQFAVAMKKEDAAPATPPDAQ